MKRAIFSITLALAVFDASLSFSQTEWQKYEGNPVLAPTESWESAYGVMVPRVLKVGDLYNNAWSGLFGVLLPNELINELDDNELVFDNTRNPPKNWKWGVRRVSVDPFFALPSAAAYGKIHGDDHAHADKVVYFFSGQPGDLNLTYEVYDIDGLLEVDVILNGVKIHDELINQAEPSDLEIAELVLLRQQARVNVSNQSNASPLQYQLAQNFPNPFNPSTTVRFEIPRPGQVRLALYNLRGELVRTIVKGELPAGVHTYTFDMANLASGMYFYQLQADDFAVTRKMVLLKDLEKFDETNHSDALC